MKHMLLPALAALALSSCAYVQTHKNVEEQGGVYQGHQLDNPKQLFQSGGQWYIAAKPATYRKSHDIIHDNVFYKTNEPEMKLLHAQDSVEYHAISAGTAAVLLRPDGYAHTTTLAQEITESQSPWLSSLPRASSHTVRAQFADEKGTAVTTTRSPEETPFGWRVLANLDLLLVDVPGTLAYNVAVPVIVPFVFFYDFFSEQ